MSRTELRSDRTPIRSLLLRAFEHYVRGQFARHFATVRLGPADHTSAAFDQSIPTLFLANHANWWDGFLAFLVSRELGVTSHLLMDAVQLARYPGFRLVGAVPLRRSPIKAAYQDLLAAHSRLQPNAGLWMFPQGARRPQAERPKQLERGAAELAVRHGAPLRIWSVAFRYVYLGEQLPEAFAWLGRPWLLEPGRYRDRRVLMPLLGRDLLMSLDALDDLLRHERLSAFRTLVEGRLSINKRMDRFRHAVGLLRGRFEAGNG